MNVDFIARVPIILDAVAFMALAVAVLFSWIDIRNKKGCAAVVIVFLLMLLQAVHLIA